MRTLDPHLLMEATSYEIDYINLERYLYGPSASVNESSYCAWNSHPCMLIIIEKAEILM